MEKKIKYEKPVIEDLQKLAGAICIMPGLCIPGNGKKPPKKK